MKNSLMLILVVYSIASCVQKSSKKTVKFVVDVSKEKKIKSVGIRGNGGPLSWDKDLEMKPLFAESLYTVTVSAVTGFKFAEVKFTVNGEFELEKTGNRKVVFTNDSITVYNAIFNVEKK